MAAHTVNGRKLTGTRFAAMLRTPYPTFEHWLRTIDKEPPGSMALVMDLLEQVPAARAHLGIDEAQEGSGRLERGTSEQGKADPLQGVTAQA